MEYIGGHLAIVKVGRMAGYANGAEAKTPADQETIVHYSDPQWVLGGQWTPALPKLP